MQQRDTRSNRTIIARQFYLIQYDLTHIDIHESILFYILFIISFSQK